MKLVSDNKQHYYNPNASDKLYTPVQHYYSPNTRGKFVCFTDYHKEKAIVDAGLSLQLEAKLGIIRVGAGIGSITEFEYTYEGFSCHKIEYTSVSAIIAGSKRYYKTPINCVTKEKIGETLYEEENFFLWFKWDKKGNIRQEIDFGYSVPCFGIATVVPLE